MDPILSNKTLPLQKVNLDALLELLQKNEIMNNLFESTYQNLLKIGTHKDIGDHIKDYTYVETLNPDEILGLYNQRQEKAFYEGAQKAIKIYQRHIKNIITPLLKTIALRELPKNTFETLSEENPMMIFILTYYDQLIHLKKSRLALNESLKIQIQQNTLEELFKKYIGQDKIPLSECYTIGFTLTLPAIIETLEKLWKHETNFPKL